MKQPHYTKKGPGRRHNPLRSTRTLFSGELSLRGNKLARKAKRKTLTVNHGKA